MTHSQTGAEQRGGARKNFITRVLAAADEYESRGLTMPGLAAEVLSAVRDFRRRLPGNQGKRLT